MLKSFLHVLYHIGGVICVLLLYFAWLGSILKIRSEEKLILYVSTGCPHCSKVEKFIEDEGLQEEIETKNVTEDDGAADEYTEFFEENDVPLAQQGTPTLIAQSDDDFDWVVGDQPIIEFLAEKYDIEIKNEEDSFNSEEFIYLGLGAIIVSFVIGYGIVKIANGKSKN